MADTSIVNGELTLKLLPHMSEMTHNRFGQLWLENAEANARHLGQGQSIERLRNAPLKEGDSAVVIAAGPSLKRHDPGRKIVDTGYRGTLIATDSAMAYCLRNGLVPDLVVTLDPHATRIVRWFGDPSLTEENLRQDDYFKRQDQDDAFADELRANDEMLELLSRHGKNMRIALSTSASQAVVNRAIETGMQIYWWNPMFDDPDKPGSASAKLQAQNGMPCINAGGNVGTACWMMADVVLAKKHVALVGVDFSYYDGTPYKNTQYYKEAVNLVGQENLDSLFVRIFNPHLGEWFYTDPAYFWYREAFLELVQDADCKTYNCTEGGILFGDNIEVVRFDEFLDTFRS
ncbi:MAG: motility associated factor glycosyltransferase family protein [Rhodospirillales bacterium]|nr:motility associated factor glycosyltransferase family protein [Rhodospirillales bacterium]